MMVPSSPGSPGPRPAQQPKSAEKPLPSKRPADPALVERVLRQTLTMCGANEPLGAESRKALREVVSRHRGKPFGLEPVAVELVAAVLQSQMAAGSESSDIRQAVTLQVARTLCEDPASRRRLEGFWERLNEG